MWNRSLIKTGPGYGCSASIHTTTTASRYNALSNKINSGGALSGWDAGDRSSMTCGNFYGANVITNAMRPTDMKAPYAYRYNQDLCSKEMDIVHVLSSKPIHSHIVTTALAHITQASRRTQRIQNKVLLCNDLVVGPGDICGISFYDPITQNAWSLSVCGRSMSLPFIPVDSATLTPTSTAPSTEEEFKAQSDPSELIRHAATMVSWRAISMGISTAICHSFQQELQSEVDESVLALDNAYGKVHEKQMALEALIEEDESISLSGQPAWRAEHEIEVHASDDMGGPAEGSTVAIEDVDDAHGDESDDDNKHRSGISYFVLPPQAPPDALPMVPDTVQQSSKGDKSRRRKEKEAEATHTMTPASDSIPSFVTPRVILYGYMIPADEADAAIPFIISQNDVMKVLLYFLGPQSKYQGSGPGSHIVRSFTLSR